MNRAALAWGVALALAVASGCAGGKPVRTPTPVTAAATPTSTPAPVSTPTASPPATGAPAGYERSCAAEFPWGRQVSRGFVCIEPQGGGLASPPGGLPSPPGSLASPPGSGLKILTVRGYAGGSFENNVVVDLVRVSPDGSAGERLVRTATTYIAPDLGMPGPWAVQLTWPTEVGVPMRVIAFFESPRDGARVAEDSLDLK